MSSRSGSRERSSGGFALAFAVTFFLVAAAAFALVATGVVGPGSATPGDGGDATDGSKASVSPKDPGDYSWEELSQISSLVADAADDAQGLAVARAYNLVDDSGTPVTAPIDVTLSDGTPARAQLIGVRHDARSGGGVAGLTYMLSVVADEPMAGSDSTQGGWESSELRAWAASAGRDLLPEELSSHIIAVSKMTNNTGVADDASCVSETEDELWCLSVPEVCGPVTWFADEYGPTMACYDDVLNAEGTQYAYFSAAGVTGETDPAHALALSYRGAAWSWWYRTPYPYVFMGRGDSGSFFQVTATGFPSSVGLAGTPSGVVLGFCL